MENTGKPDRVPKSPGSMMNSKKICKKKFRSDSNMSRELSRNILIMIGQFGTAILWNETDSRFAKQFSVTLGDRFL